MRSAKAAIEYERFVEPPSACRPMVRWWWFGCALSKRELARELDEMHRAGIGGVEIQPVYPLAIDEPQKGIVNCAYLSDEWLEHLKFIVDRAKQYDMIVDVTFGSGWPFGGPWIDKQHSAGCIKVRVKDFDSDEPKPQRYRVELSRNDDEELLAAHLYRRQQGRLAAGKSRDLSGSFDADGRGRFELPPGKWRVLAFVRTHTGMQVKRPAVGAEGLVLDHFSREAFAKHAEHVAWRLRRAIGDEYGKTVRAMFCDSYEVYRSNWTRALLDEFEQRRGYNLRPHLAHLFYRIDERTPLIRYDYARTRSELSLEEFFQPFAQWCRKHGVRSRVQAHGGPADILAAYASADIPEGESFGEADTPAVDVQHRRIASSAAHNYGKRICSNESFTWLRKPRFCVTLEQMKVAADSIFLDGLNHIVGHGFSYSPPEADKPGWAFYASTLINHNNTWWPYFRHLADYITRCSYVFQTGEYSADVAVYLPTHDAWSETKADVFNLGRLLHERLDRDVLLQINRRGWSFDFVNDAVLRDAGRMQRFSVLVLPNSGRMPVESARSVVYFLNHGSKVVAFKRWPAEAPGLIDHEKRSAHVRELFEAVRQRGTQCSRLAQSGAELLAAIGSWLRPDCRIESEQENIGFIHYRSGDRDVYFVANLSPEAIKAWIRLRSTGRAVSFWDPMTGHRHAASGFSFSDGGASGSLKLDPFESKMIVLSQSTGEGMGVARKLGRVVHNQELGGPWQLVEADSGRALKRMASLRFWTAFRELRGYSGMLGYRTVFEWSQTSEAAGRAIVIEFEDVREVVEVHINGQHVKDLWIRPFRCEVTEAVQPGRNELDLRVSNLLINRAIASGRPDHSQLVARYGRRFPDPREHEAEYRDSGLAGKATLTVREVSYAAR